MIDSAGYRQQLLEYLAGCGVILRFASFDQVDQQFRRDVAVSNQQAVNVEHGRQQPFVMARQDLQVGLCVFQCRDFNVPALHVANAVLGGDDAFLCGELKLGVEVVVGFCSSRVLEQDFL